jgi:hypothetical protein
MEDYCRKVLRDKEKQRIVLEEEKYGGQKHRK